MKAFGGRLIASKKSVIIWIAMKHAYKFVIGAGSKGKRWVEIKRNQKACKDPFWSGVVMPVRKIPFGLITDRCQPIDQDDPRIAGFIETRLEKLREHKREPAVQLTDMTAMESLTGKGLSEKVCRKIKSYLGEFQLPVSSAHGDFHQDNFLIYRGRLVLIDWRFYRERSSFLFDLLHYYVRKVCSQTKKSWVDVTYDQVFHLPEVELLVRTFDLSREQLSVGYGINRVSLEQEGPYESIDALPAKLQEKYLRLFFYIENLLR